MADYDVIVIGCGPAGMMACGELAKRGVKQRKQFIIDADMAQVAGKVQKA